jgi:hypothetical protein
MPKAIGQFMAIAGLAIKELVRQPVCLLLILTASVLTLLLPQSVAHQLGQQASLARDSALAFQLVFGVMLAGYAAGSTLHSECVSGTVLTIFSRPVGRATFFLAKLSAVATIIVLFVWITIAVALITENLTPHYFETNLPGNITALTALLFPLGIAALLNFRSGRSFAASALLLLPWFLTAAAIVIGSFNANGAPVAFASRLAWIMVPAGIMGGLALLILATLALTLATRLKPAPTVVLLAVIFGAGLMSDYLVSLGAGMPALQLPLRAILPDIQSFWLADDLMAGTTIPAGTLWHGVAYAAAYSTGAAGLGILLFRHRDF